MKRLNLGCGSRYQEDWTNIDFVSSGTTVIAHDLRNRLPFGDNSFDVVYHSHVLEHFSPKDARKFLLECCRVLNPGGVLRVAVPDLEQIVREYTRWLDLARKGALDAAVNYDWMMLELYDQTVRNRAGGQMAEYLLSGAVPNEDYVVSRIGTEGRRLIDIGKTKQANGTTGSHIREKLPLLRKIRNFMSPRRRLIKFIAGSRSYEDLSRETKIGKFRESGEIHQWMYDEFSLGRLLESVNFCGVCRRESDQSYLSNWASENLDTNADGGIYKPDSLFMEWRKPDPMTSQSNAL